MMNITQKKLFYRIEAKIRNQKLCHTYKAFFSTSVKECPLYDLDDAIYEYTHKNIGLGIFSCVMLVGVIIVLVDMCFHENTIDSLLFYAIPSATACLVFFLTIQKRVFINSKAGIFEFFATQEAMQFLISIIDAQSVYTKFETSMLSDLTFDAQLASLKQKYSSEHIDKKLLPKWVDDHAELLLKSLCPICNRRKGINAIKIGTAFGVIIYTVIHNEVVIGCEECINAAVKKANWTSLCLGIWSMPWGIVMPPLAIWKNNHNLKNIQMNIPSKTLKKHIVQLLKK